MTLSDGPPEATPYPSRRVTLTLDVGRPWVVVLWAAFIFLTGAITGASLLHLGRPGPPPGHHPGSPLPRHFAEHMQHDLDLSDEQTAAIEEIVAKYEPRFRATSEEAKAQLRADLEEMNREILPLLDERQRGNHQQQWRDMLERRPPPPHHRPPPRH